MWDLQAGPVKPQYPSKGAKENWVLPENKHCWEECEESCNCRYSYISRQNVDVERLFDGENQASAEETSVKQLNLISHRGPKTVSPFLRQERTHFGKP
ncbi:hypothetical protein J6590_007392 [Homalodisca vitripennis]|nr:hypothetical protein J6590_007392 [Homalodisca vitripennis]